MAESCGVGQMVIIAFLRKEEGGVSLESGHMGRAGKIVICDAILMLHTRTFDKRKSH